MFLFCFVFAMSLCASAYMCSGSPAGKGLSFVVSNFKFNILGQVWYLIVSIPDLCNLTYFVKLE